MDARIVADDHHPSPPAELAPLNSTDICSTPRTGLAPGLPSWRDSVGRDPAPTTHHVGRSGPGSADLLALAR